MATHHTVRVWDLPTRLFHWALVLCVLGLVVTGKLGGLWMTWHFRLGYGVMSLLLFRLVWGVVGGRWSRFASFVVGPGRVWAYVRGRLAGGPSVGHNPLGALSVLAMLALLGFQVATGLISDDEISNQGPLARFAPSHWMQWAYWWHKEVGAPLVLGLIAVHLLAIAVHTLCKRHKLIGPMIRGDASLPHPAQPSRDDVASRLLALAVFLGCVAVVYGVQSLGLP